MLPQCQGPIWAIDDFSPCFQRNFLQTILPLAACGLSLLFILLRVAYRFSVARRIVAYRTLPQNEHEADRRDAEQSDEEETDPVLRKAVEAEHPHLELDRPRGEIIFVVVEAIALLGLVATFVAILITRGWGRHGTLPAAAGLISWGYILFLVLMRLLLSAKGLRTSPRLWSHTAALYALQWLFAVFVFRSAIIHPLSRQARTYSVIIFALNSLLLMISLTTRRGNKAVLIPLEDGLEPPRHPTASLLSLASFSWLDPLVMKAYRQPLELEDVWNLTVSQQAATVLEDFRHKHKKGSLLWRLAKYFYGPILVQGAWTMFSCLFVFLPTLLLKAILEYVEDPRSTTPNAAWLYASLLFCAGAIQGVADGQALWMGRRLGVKLRAIIIGEIYAKALRRKAGAIVDATENKDTITADASQTDQKKDKESEEAADGQANVGTIINLMAIDSFKVSEVGAYLHFLWASVPVQVIIAVILLYRILGFSSFAGIVLMVLVLPINLFIARRFQAIQNQILKGTDARIHATNEVLSNIRIIKYFAWERRFEDVINEKRRAELRSLRFRYVLWSLAATLWYGTPILITFTSFFLYTVIEKKRLTPSIAFPALSMFSLLRVPLDQLADMVAHVQECKVSLDRVDKYLNEEETDKFVQLRDSGVPGAAPKIALEKATLSWGSSKPKTTAAGGGSTSDAAEAFRLIDVDVDFQIGKLNVVAGPTGAGKTSLLMALLGEMRLQQGRVYLPGGTANRATLPVNPETGLMECVAYCAQEAWLVNATVKENIVFASPFDEHRYNAVIKACALERDLAILDAGDQTLVGEKGISLSGGQKQRISLARAIYSRARHLLLDDCLSAVDSHTAKHIFRQALTGPLMLHRTCILVTHNVSLAVPEADYVVVLENGKVAVQGRPDEVAASGALGEELLKSRPETRVGSQRVSRVPSDLEDHLSKPSTAARENGAANGAAASTANGSAGAKDATAKPKKDGDRLTESKAVGSIKWSTVLMYLGSMGPWYYWIAAVVVFFLQQFAAVAPNLWIRQWANAASLQQHGSHGGPERLTTAVATTWKMPSFVAGSVPRMVSWGLTSPFSRTQATFSVATTDDEVSVSYYLTVYAVLGAAYILISLLREGALFWGSLHASYKIHERLLKAVMHAKFKFFDSTPLGQLMNRFSKDVEAIDQEVATAAIAALHCLATVIMIVILISVITPGFLIAGIFILMIYTAIGTIYINSSRDLKRLESVQRSPLYQQFGETLNGIVTIRAYGDGPRFIQDNHRRINSYNRPHIYMWASNRWLAFRVDVTGALVAFFSAAFVLLNVGKIDAGAAGLSLTYAVTFTENVLWLVRLYSQVQQDMNSVERVKEYIDVDQEAPEIIEDCRPPAGWPSKGSVEFVDYTTRYRPDLEPVLKSVTFAVQPGEKVGIVGRTGAGKSSLALALFRGLEAERGQIVIDGVDISRIGLRDLREAITIVPQDPTLFTGTIRSNLDPFGLFTDEQIFTALRRVHLIGSTASGTATPMTGGGGSSSTFSATAISTPNDATPSPTTPIGTVPDNKNIFRNLDSPVSESGSNLSQGQRQLLCLARALLKNPRVLMMDEATASIDYATDAKIQKTLRELKDNTIITIAHRLQTIIDYDKVLVLDHGEVVEFDHPWVLINRTPPSSQDGGGEGEGVVGGGLFRSMCENSGNMEGLMEGAKKAWEETERKRKSDTGEQPLVDDS